VGEVFPEGGEIERLAVLNHAKPKDAKPAAVWKNSLRTRSGLPIPGKLPCPQGRTSTRISSGSCRIVGQSVESAQRQNALRLFLFVVTELEGLRIAQVGADIELKNSMLDFDFDKRLIKSSMASTVERGLKTLRSTHTRLNSSGGKSNSSLRVPER